MRGLKCIYEPSLHGIIESHRSRGAWIEILKVNVIKECQYGRIAHAVRGLKSQLITYKLCPAKSHRSRGAWIEIFFTVAEVDVSCVASLTRCVD